MPGDAALGDPLTEPIPGDGDLGIALKAMGRNQEAVREWQAALEVEPEDETGAWAGSRAQRLLNMIANMIAEEEGREKDWEEAAKPDGTSGEAPP